MKVLISLLLVLLFITPAFGQVLPIMERQVTTWNGCGTATASTGNIAIKAAVTSGFIYITTITCANSAAATATNLNFKDGTIVIAVGGVSQMAAGSDGSFYAEFPVPLKGSKNTAFNFNTDVSVTSVICCGAGYVSAN